MIDIENLRIGDDVLIRMQSGLPQKQFGSGWILGVVTDIRNDILSGEQIIVLDDGPRVYANQIDFVVGFASAQDVAG